MNRKGFTLIELLAVIVILGIILTFAVPSITNIYKESKLKKVKMDFLLNNGVSLDSYIYINNETESYSLAYTGSLISYATVDCHGYWLNSVTIMKGSFNSDKDNIYLKEWNLRDALFEMLKWLKVNKCI